MQAETPSGGRPPRIAVGCMMHETNTFTAGRTALEDFAPVSGERALGEPGMEGSPAAGILDALRAEGAEVSPTLFGRALPGGVVEREAYETMKAGILDGVRRAGPLDGVCLALHGSMYAEGVEDPEGDLLRSLRDLVGEAMPIVCALDMHASMTEAMVEAADGFTAYRTAPHLDAYETGARAARMLTAALRDGVALRPGWVPLPMLLCGEQSETSAPPMDGLMSLLARTEQEPGILSADYLLGFPWADAPHNRVSVCVTGDDRADQDPRSVALRLAREFWDRRREFAFTTEAYPPDEALKRATETPDRPVVVADASDNPGAGASEDVTFLLERMLHLGVEDALLAVIVDGAARRACAEAGVGASVGLSLGRLEPGGAPLEVEARVSGLGLAGEAECTVVRIGGVTVVIADRRMPVHDPDELAALGPDPRDYKVVAIKSGYLSPEYDAIAAAKMLALAPGDTDQTFSNLPYSRTERPVYPLDDNAHWNPEDLPHKD